MTLKGYALCYALALAVLAYFGPDYCAAFIASFIVERPSAEQLDLARVGLWIAVIINGAGVVFGYVLEKLDGKGSFRID